MVVLNRIINILILLAAIAAAVFSYLLFSKREKLVNGWAQMATAINTAAKTIDDSGASGTSASKDLTEEKLKHTNYEQLGQVLPKLRENTSKIVAQRNELADTLQKAAGRLNISGVAAQNLKNVASYKDQERIFTHGVQQFRSNRDALSREYARTFGQFGVSVSSEELCNPQTTRTAISRGNLKVKESIERRDTYASYLGQISRALGLPSPQISGPAYRAELSKALQGAQEKRRELNTTKSLLAAERRKTQQLSRQIAGQQKTISSQQQNILGHQKEISRLNNILNKDGSIKLPEKLLTSKDPECYKFVRGMVEYVDNDYGFITINIGRHYTFVQNYGIKKNRVLFPLEPGKIMTVARNFDSANPLFIGKVFVAKVDDNSAVCNLVDGHPELYQKGDTVFFSDEDIAKALNVNKAPAKK